MENKKMIDYFQIQRLANDRKISEDVIEKDYFIELFLYYLCSYFKPIEKLIFRGGTSLKKMYFPDYRFSEDLDFIIDKNEDLKNYETSFNKLLEKISSDYPFTATLNSNIKNDRLQIYINYDIFVEIKMIKTLKVDILKDDYIPTFVEKNIIFTFQDFAGKNLKLYAYTLESVASEKIIRILDVDKEARDIYDLWYLLKLDILKIDSLKNELGKKLKTRLYFNNLINSINSSVYRNTWEIRLKNQIKDLPDYEYVARDLEKLIKNKLIQR
jgi:uncharacterized protein